MVLGTLLLDKVKEGRGLSKPYVTGERAVDTSQTLVVIDQSLMTSMSGVFQRTATLLLLPSKKSKLAYKWKLNYSLQS